MADDQDGPVLGVLGAEGGEESGHAVGLDRDVVRDQGEVGGPGQGQAGVERAGGAAGVDCGDAGVFQAGGEGLGAGDPLGREGLEGIELPVRGPAVELLGVADEVDGVQGGGRRREEGENYEGYIEAGHRSVILSVPVAHVVPKSTSLCRAKAKVPQVQSSIGIFLYRPPLLP